MWVCLCVSGRALLCAKSCDINSFAIFFTFFISTSLFRVSHALHRMKKKKKYASIHNVCGVYGAIRIGTEKSRTMD